MKLKQFSALEVVDYEDEVPHYSAHSHTYYEIVYIHSGTGRHLLNGREIYYGGGDVYLISPVDVHSFDPAVATHFTVLKFTPDFITMHASFNGDLKVLDRTKQLMQHAWVKENKIQVMAPYDQILKRTMTNLAEGYLAGRPVNEIWFYQQFLSLIELCRMSIDHSKTKDFQAVDTDHLIDYVHENIYQPALLKIAHIARRFHISESYFSNFFKKTYGESFRSYCNAYKLALIETRLSSSDKSVKKIAEEFGFHDSSHFYHFYKTIRGESPEQYRKRNFNK